MFLSAFLAATILPFSSEIVLGLLLAGQLNPAMLLATATAGNILGAVVNYGIGLWGSAFLIKRVWRISEDEFIQAEQRFRKYGTGSLFFAWVPVIGDPLTVIAGVLRVRFPVFLILVGAGKFIRYLLIVWTVGNCSP